jgi:hypothetical protein
MEEPYVHEIQVDQTLYRLEARRSGDQFLLDIRVPQGNHTAEEIVGGVVAPIDHLGPLRAALDQVLNHFGAKAYSLQAIREHHPSAYARWSTEEEQELVSRFDEGATIEELAALLGRQAGGIRSRLARLGRLDAQTPTSQPSASAGQAPGHPSPDPPPPRTQTTRESSPDQVASQSLRRRRLRRWGRIGWPRQHRP